MEHLQQVLEENPYPGRGVLWARTGGGALCGGYFLTGRSPASRSRVLLRRTGELTVAPTGPAERDALRHYPAAREGTHWLVFGNGEQVATITERLTDGASPAAALDQLDYEPDPPIFTPRISVVVDLDGPGTAWFGAARRSLSGRSASNRLTVAVTELEPGDCVLMTTYVSDGREIVTGAPFIEARTTAGSRDEFVDEVWNALNPELRVAAAAFEPGQIEAAAIRQVNSVAHAG
ncbi:IMP cyclohydrolase [Streptomyces phaeochromogenes]|uniref:IMP cyclohydrolase n=1 Tax=Streptomyces phaeochromogenes TaxID=1923 RepID=UPI0033E69EE8